MVEARNRRRSSVDQGCFTGARTQACTCAHLGEAHGSAVAPRNARWPPRRRTASEAARALQSGGLAR